MVDLFSQLGIKYCVAYGTLLGYVRERSLMAHDDDADLFTEVGACALVKASKKELRKYGLVLWEDPIWPGHFSLIKRVNQLQQWPFVECFTLLESAARHGRAVRQQGGVRALCALQVALAPGPWSLAPDVQTCICCKIVPVLVLPLLLLLRSLPSYLLPSYSIS